MTYINGITQNVVADPLNSSTSNIIASGSFVGTASSTLGVAGIQVSLYTTQNCTIWAEQSPDGTNWDISDSYNYYSSINNFGITVQAVSSYCRVIVKNIGTISTTAFRLETALCPIVEALPRTLTADGNLKVAIQEFSDKYGFEVENTPTGEMRTVSPFRLVGSTFSGSTLDINYWTAGSVTGSASVVLANAQAIITTGSIANGGTNLQSFRVARYVAGNSNRARIVLRLPDTGVTNNVRRWGAFNTTDGAFFELAGTTLKAVTRKTGLDTPVSSGSFNGELGLAIPIPTDVRTWEIYWTNSGVWFTINGHPFHTVSPLTTTWCDNLSLPLRFENINSNSASAVVQLNIRGGSIARLGSQLTQPTSFYISGSQTSGSNLKIGAGNLQSMIINGVTNNAVITLSDSISTTTPTIFSMTATATSGIPVPIDFKGLPFHNGLRLIITAANASVTVIYE